MSEELEQHLSDPFDLNALLLHHRKLENLSSGEFNRKDTYTEQEHFISTIFG